MNIKNLLFIVFAITNPNAFSQSKVIEIFSTQDSSYFNTIKTIDNLDFDSIQLIPTWGFNDREANYKILANKCIVFNGSLITDGLKGRTDKVFKIKKEKRIILKILDGNGKLIFKKRIRTDYKKIILIKYPEKWEILYTNNLIGWD